MHILCSLQPIPYTSLQTPWLSVRTYQVDHPAARDPVSVYGCDKSRWSHAPIHSERVLIAHLCGCLDRGALDTDLARVLPLLIRARHKGSRRDLADQNLSAHKVLPLQA